MKCIYHQDKTAVGTCSQCEKNVCEQCAIPKADGSVICSRCVALEAAREAGNEIDNRLKEKEINKHVLEDKKKNKRKIWMVFLGLILATCIAVIVIQLPGIMRLVEDEKPIRYGTYSTDAVTDQCIKNLWHISGMLQKGKMPDSETVCPESQSPYPVTETEDDTVIHCPDPLSHGFRDIKVSRRKPVPEVIK